MKAVKMKRTRGALVTVSDVPAAARAAMEIMASGGSAADAAAAGIAAQIVFSAGSYTSFGGMCSILYFNASSGKVYAVSGEMGIPLGEHDPMSIPTDGATPNGRRVLIPGVPAALETLVSSFGKLKLADALAPAIKMCRKGVPVGARLAAELEKAAAEGFEPPFLHVESGTVYQPQLAETLTRFAAQGGEYIYRGGFARRFTDICQSCGGRVTMRDMRSYTVPCEAAHCADIAGCSAFYPPDPNRGSLVTLFGVKLLCENAAPQHYTTCGAALARFARLMQGYELLAAETFDPGFERSAPEFMGRSLTLGNCFDSDMLHGIAQSIGSPPVTEKSGNTDAIITVDAEGNMAVAIHSAAGSGFSEKLHVGGVTLCNQAGRYRALVMASGAGKKMRTFFNPTIFLKDGVPAVGSVAMHSALYERAICCLYNFVAHGMDIEQAQNTPGPLFFDGESYYCNKNLFEAAVLAEAMKHGCAFLDITESPAYKYAGSADRADGLWLAAGVDSGGIRSGISCPYYDGITQAEDTI